MDKTDYISLIAEQNEADSTLRYYEDHAEEFTANTIDADMKDIRSRFLTYLPEDARILDFGCGTGRDTKAFLDLSYEVAALDGSPSLCRIAGEYTGIPVQCMDFREYSSSEGEYYDGIWACASLLHLRRKDLFPVMQELGKAMKAGAVLNCSVAESVPSFVPNSMKLMTETPQMTQTALLNNVRILSLMKK